VLSMSYATRSRPSATACSSWSGVPGSEQVTTGRKPLSIVKVGHLTHLIDDLLDVTRIARNKIRLQCERST